MRLNYFHASHLLFGLYKQETEILRRKDDGNITTFGEKTCFSHMFTEDGILGGSDFNSCPGYFVLEI
jgi:hypothetical protein